MVDFHDSICGLSSGRVPAGIAVIRLSGPQTRSALETLCGSVPAPRRASHRAIHNAEGVLIDAGLVLFFPGPSSFTGEDCAEFQVHGGRAVVGKLLDVLVALPGIRLAEAGEFTRRAFLNGKVDLLEAEALADLIAAETEAQRRLAIRNAEGAQSGVYLAWRQRLIQARALIEAELDFADEGDVPGSVSDQVWRDVRELQVELSRHLEAYHRAEIIRDGYDVVIVGSPNAGKSSLLNALAKREVAIVSEEPGTTRDLVEVVLDLKGLKVRVTDTAGIRDAAGKIEAIGIERALDRARQADLVLLVTDVSVVGSDKPLIDHAAVARIGTKVDLRQTVSDEAQFAGLISSVTGQGIPELLDLIWRHADDAVGSLGDVLPSRIRHRELLAQASDALSSSLSEHLVLELRAEELRAASACLGRISGAVDVEDLLDVIFSQFCIGK